MIKRLIPVFNNCSPFGLWLKKLYKNVHLLVKFKRSWDKGQNVDCCMILCRLLLKETTGWFFGTLDVEWLSNKFAYQVSVFPQLSPHPYAESFVQEYFFISTLYIFCKYKLASESRETDCFETMTVSNDSRILSPLQIDDIFENAVSCSQ